MTDLNSFEGASLQIDPLDITRPRVALHSNKGLPQCDELTVIKNHVNFKPSSPAPGQEWRGYAELPTSNDLNPDWDDAEQVAKIGNLPENKWQQPWESKEAYLSTHYHLQREEAITMLRKAIRKFKTEPTMMDDEETCVYTKVYVKGYLMTRLGPMCQVQFSTERSGKKIRWTQTRRLTVGTLVALSPVTDCFKTICMPAVISDHRVRDGLDQNPPTIHFQWTNINDAVIDPNQELVMVETRFGYFEAVRHSMVGLQHVANTETVLDKYLVQADKSDLPATHVEQHPRMDIRSLVHHIPNESSMTQGEMLTKMAEVRKPLQNYSILDGFDAQLSRYTNLDNSQLSAVHRILTKELAIVQGPPGTGKTFTSVQALQILLATQQRDKLASQHRGSKVIIVAAQTNHAVDQILLQLINSGSRVVRLGGRTQNEEIKQYSMYNLRRATKIPSAIFRADSDFKNADARHRSNMESLEGLADNVFPHQLIDPETLHLAGIITTEQLMSLETDEIWITVPTLPGQPTGTMADWLGKQLVKVRLHDEKDPDFDAVEDDDGLDLDDEDYDLELDDFVDEYENGNRLEGRFIPLKHEWSGANPQSLTDTDLVIRRELKKSNLWNIDVKYRGAVYQYWQRELLLKHRDKFREILADDMRIAKSLKINRWYKDTLRIKASSVEIIGCTTTGLCKYRGLLAALQPRTMLIEEAAETREANILSALYGSLQQLILVGDHQQLAPHCDTPGLADAPYYMRVSMFERLVRLNIPFTMLNMQRRMIPALREVLNPFYPSLQDHPVVTRWDARPPVPGMAVPSFFFHHTWVEALDENLSRFNILEAEMIVKFIDYLLMNGVQANQITVLTFYRGQKKKILAECKKKLKQWAPFNNVFTVDSYQGEENDIILLSLVRSNGQRGPHKAGFLQDQNRGVVSISRARRGFYIFGNMINLAKATHDSWVMWGRVQRVFESQNRFGGNSRLPITCQNHGKTTWISHPEDWVNCHGGCDQRCPGELRCGHACGRQCHWVSHDKLICQNPCEVVLSCNHRCQQVCGEKCVCTCDDFTGAYSHDVFPTGDMVSSGGVGYNHAHIAPFITTAQKVATTVSGGRKGPSGSQLRHGDTRGLGYRDRSGHDGGSSLESRFVRASNDKHHNWAAFDAGEDDRKKIRDAREKATDTSPNGAVTAIHDSFRSVTVVEKGKRTLGEQIGSMLKPEKENDKDLLNFEDAVTVTALTERSPSLADVSSRPTPQKQAAGGVFSPVFPPVQSPRRQSGASTSTPVPTPTSAPVSARSPLRALVHRPVSVPTSLPVPVTASVPLSIRTVRQADQAEWESGSIADTAAVAEEEGEEEDLISF